jgi:hypothetical protein
VLEDRFALTIAKHLANGVGIGQCGHQLRRFALGRICHHVRYDMFRCGRNSIGLVGPLVSRA